MSLIVVFTNDSTGNVDTGNYDVRVYINDTLIEMGRIEKHERNKGWKELVKRLANTKTTPNTFKQRGE